MRCARECPRTGIRIWAFLTIVLLTSPYTAGAGHVLNVQNDSDNVNVLSDLIAFGEGGAKATILKPNDPSDDIVMPPGGIRTFDAGFDVTSYFVSSTINNNEYDTGVFDVTLPTPRKFSFLENAQSGVPLVVGMIFSQTDYQPPVGGTVLNFVDGLNLSLPGYFVGTNLNFDTGAITGPFTGTARFLEPQFVVSVVPEPASLAILTSGIALLSLHARRSSNRDTR